MVHKPNPVQSISQQRQQFQVAASSQEQQIQQQMHSLSLEIYARRVALDMADTSYTEPLQPPHLRKLAADSQAAARAFFEALGVKFAEAQTDAQS